MTLLERYPAHLLAGCLVAGLAAANVARVHSVALAVALSLALSFVAFPTGFLRFIALGAALVALGWWWGSGRLDRLDRSPLVAHVGEAGRVVATVDAPPKTSRYGIRVIGMVRSLEGVSIGEGVLLEFPLGRGPPQGALIAATASIRAPRAASHGFDERQWLRRQGIHVVVRVSTWRAIGRRDGVGGVADRIHTWLGRAIAPGMTGERRAVLVGIVLGDDGGLSDSLKQRFRAAGLFHLLAVSGQNVVLVAAGVLLLAWLLGIPRVAGEVGALAGIGAYVLAVGAQPSVIRAGVAGSLASLAWLAGRLPDAWYTLLLGAIALLGWNPYLVFDPGFELSFAAVGAIFAVAPRLRTKLEGYPLPDHLRTAVAVSAACGVVTAPVLWFRFGQLPLLTIPANALAEPAMSIVLELAFVTAGVGLVDPSAATLLAWCNGWVTAYIAGCARLIGSLPGAQLAVSDPTSPQALAGAAAVVLLAAWIYVRSKLE